MALDHLIRPHRAQPVIDTSRIWYLDYAQVRCIELVVPLRSDLPTLLGTMMRTFRYAAAVNHMAMCFAPGDFPANEELDFEQMTSMTAIFEALCSIWSRWGTKDLIGLSLFAHKDMRHQQLLLKELCGMRLYLAHNLSKQSADRVQMSKSSDSSG